VVIFALLTAAAGVMHERIALPSISTVQAPQMPTPQPYFQDLSSMSLRST
jgi:hypothetical protein